MAKCPVCDRPLKRLANHLRKVHNLFHNTTEPSNLKEFIRFLKLFPLSAEHWAYILKHRKEIKRFCDDDTLLPSELFQILYNNFDKYRSNKGQRLVILNGLFPAKNVSN